MKTRRLGAVPAGVLLAVSVATALPANGSEPDRTVEARAANRPVELDLSSLLPPPTRPTTTTTTAPPRPEPDRCPVAGPVEFVDSWGFRRSGGRRHQGVDMMAAEGTPVVAPVDGVVTNRDNRTGGLSYHLIAADGTYFYGTHLSAYGTNGLVEAGTVIGYVGDTGNARGTPHLHFEVHPGGEGAPAVNPYPFAAEWCGVGA